MEYKIIGPFLERMRKENNLTQEDLAKECNVDLSLVQALEREDDDLKLKDVKDMLLCFKTCLSVELIEEGYTPEEGAYYNALYTKVGFIIHLSQMIEHNYCLINSYCLALRDYDENPDRNLEDIKKKADEEYKKFSIKPMGEIIKELNNNHFIDEKIKETFSNVKKMRDTIIHQLFKIDLKYEMIEKKDQNLLAELTEFIGTESELNSILVDILNEKKEKYQAIKTSKKTN